MTNKRSVILVVLALLQVATCYPNFHENIPNGEVVPSPCNPNYVWKGVGHLNKNGGGERNPFGKDFAANGMTWTNDLCTKDSDGDGKTNGEELGDPDCEWFKGDQPRYSVGLSHPGFCEPFDSDMCKGINGKLDCSASEFACDALSEPGVFNFTLKLTKSQVPAKETEYVCQTIDLPSDKDYHIVATQPFIDNINVLHHIVVYGCNITRDLTVEETTPQSCFMTQTEGCSELIGIWAVGADGMCYDKNAGIRIGKTSYNRALVELHWNNPELKSTYMDGSGLTLFLTPNLRQYDAGMMTFGQSMLLIPPGRQSHVINGTCPSKCTEQQMSGPINLTGILNHMHYLGSAAYSNLRSRTSGELIPLGIDEVYSYDSPKFYLFDEPITMHPGDELELSCQFKSTSRSTTTFFGEGTYDEMCYAFLMYYPKQNWNIRDCSATGSIAPCEWTDTTVAGCDYMSLYNEGPGSLLHDPEIKKRCVVGYCLDECKEYTRDLMDHPCLTPEMRFFWQNDIRTKMDNYTTQRMKAWYMLDSCSAELAVEKKCRGGDGGWPPLIGGTDRLSVGAVLAVLPMLVALFY